MYYILVQNTTMNINNTNIDEIKFIQSMYEIDDSINYMRHFNDLTLTMKVID
jgi:hypothetical protein